MKMIVGSTHRMISSVFIKAAFNTNKQIGQVDQEGRILNAFEKNASQIKEFQDALIEEKQDYQNFIEEINLHNKSNAFINLHIVDGRTPVILSQKARTSFLIWDLGAGAAWIALGWQLVMGTASYLTFGVTAIAAALLSRESAMRFFKESRPQIIEVWKNQEGNYEIQYWHNHALETKIVEPSKFMYNVGCDVNKWYSYSLKSVDLHKWIPMTHQACTWCLVDNESYWIKSDAQINNHLFHTLL